MVSKRTFWVITLAIGGAVLGSGYVLVRGVAGDSMAGPRLERWDDAVLNLGDGKPGEILTGAFSLRNRGTEPLDFQIRASCNCSQLRPQARRIEPGEVQEILAGIRLRSEGSRERVRLSIQTNDPETPQAEYVLEANCPAPFDVSPLQVDFGSVSEGKSSKAILTVCDAQGAPLAATADLRSSVSNPHVAVEPVKGEEQERQLVVRLLPTAPRGRLQAEVTLTLIGVDSPRLIPVTAYVIGHVLTAPQTLVLPASGGEATFLVWRPDQKPLGKIRHLHVPQGIALDELSDQTVTRRRFKARNVGLSAAEGPHRIRFRFEALADDVFIDVSVE